MVRDDTLKESKDVPIGKINKSNSQTGQNSWISLSILISRGNVKA